MKREKLNIVNAIEFVGNYFEADEPDESQKNKLNRCIKFITKELEINEWQAMFVVSVIHEAWDGYSTPSNIAEFMHCSPLRMAQRKADIEQLLKLRMVRYSKQRDTYSVNHEFMEAVAQGKKYEPNDVKANLTFEELWKSILSLIKAYLVNMDDQELFVDNVEQLCQLNPQLTFCTEFLKLQKKLMVEIVSLDNNLDQVVVFLLICNKLINRNSYLEVEALEELFDESDYNFFCKRLKLGMMPLLQESLIQFAFSEGEADTSRLMLSDTAVKRFLPGYSNYVSGDEKRSYAKLTADEIAEKQLFYNEKEAKDITQLADLLKQENYKEIHQRMVDNNFRSGFTALFYGTPGTGKTETVLQLAKQTGRNIFHVNFAELKSMWVGESEKNVKNLFATYRSDVKTSDLCPILLFNEADGIIGSRMKGGSMRAVDKMENTIQNIILQEMETLDGIMIATTNLTQNIDKAFDRRFLYRVKFEKPAYESRVKIWKSMVKDLADGDAEKLAKEFEVSGGQIENVTRRNFINHLLYGTALNDYNTLADLCKSETTDSRAEKRLGF